MNKAILNHLALCATLALFIVPAVSKAEPSSTPTSLGVSAGTLAERRTMMFRGSGKFLRHFDEGHANMLIDYAHENSYNKAVYSEALRRAGFHVTDDQASLNQLPPGIQMVLVTLPDSSPVTFLESEMTNLLNFVAQGGALVIYAGKNSPAARQLAAAYGVSVETGLTLTPPLTLAPLFDPHQAVRVGKTQSWGFDVTQSNKARIAPAMQDASGHRVGLICSGGMDGKGKGTVVCLPNYGDDFQLTEENLPGIMQGVIPPGKILWPAWVKSNQRTNFMSDSIAPERMTEAGGWVYQWAEPLEPFVRNAINRFGEIRSLVEAELHLKNKTVVGWKGASSPRKVWFVAEGASGTQGLALKLGILGGMNDGIAAHEYTHYLSHYMPNSFEEGHAYLTQARVCAKLAEGYKLGELTGWEKDSLRNLKDKSIDVDKLKGPFDWTTEQKATGIMLKWEDAFGQDFMAQIIAANELVNTKAHLPLNEFLYVVEMVAKDIAGPNPKVEGMPLSQWDHEVGGMPPAVKPQRPEDIFKKALAAARTRRDPK